MIERKRIKAIKRDVDLVSLIKSRGVTLKKNGKGYKGHCPFHEDKKTPSLSVTPDVNLWQCFGCGTGGDAIKFVELFDQVDFKAAVRKLETDLPPSENRGRKTDDRKKSLESKPLTATHFKLLQRVIDFYHTAFSEDPRGGEYLASRGITDKQIISDYKFGLANGALLNVLPNEGDIMKQLQELGILNDKGTEHFYGCVTFPLYNLAGNPSGIYGRRIEGEGIDHLYLPGPRRGLFNLQAATAHKEIILTEAVIDTVTLINAGIRNTIPCYGVNGLTNDHIRLFKQHGTEKIRICFDNDESGRRGCKAVAARLREEGFEVDKIDLPEDQDINQFFSLTADAKESFEGLTQTATGGTTPPKKQEKEETSTTPDGFTFAKEKRL